MDFDFGYEAELRNEVIRSKRPKPGELERSVPTVRGWGTGRSFATVALAGTLRSQGIDPEGPACEFQVLLRVRTMAGSPSRLEVVACHRLR